MVLGDTVNTASRGCSRSPRPGRSSSTTSRAAPPRPRSPTRTPAATRSRAASRRSTPGRRCGSSPAPAARGAAPGSRRRSSAATGSCRRSSRPRGRAPTSGRARLVAVVGEAGSGKSRLLWEFFKYLDGIEEVGCWHQGRCLSYGEGVAYWALAEMVRTRAGILEEERPGIGARRSCATRSSELRPRRARAAAGRAAARAPARARGAPRRRPGRSVLAAGGCSSSGCPSDAPVILAFEDLQWADSGLLDFIDYLLEWSADYPIFVLALGRPELRERRPTWRAAVARTAPDEAMRDDRSRASCPGCPRS